MRGSLISESNPRRAISNLRDQSSRNRNSIHMIPLSRETDLQSHTDRLPSSQDKKQATPGLSVKVPRSFWKDIFGQESSTLLSQFKKNDLEPIPKAKQSHVDHIINDASNAMRKIKSLRQFKRSSMKRARVDNRSEESVNEQHMESDDSTEQAFKKQAGFSQVSMGKSLMRSCHHQLIKLQVKSENEIERLQKTIETLTKQYNELRTITESRQVEFRALSMDMDKIKSGGQSDILQTMKLQNDQSSLIENIEGERQTLLETLQENQVLRNMYLNRKTDMISLTTPFQNDEKRLRLVKDVVQHESQQLASQSKHLDSLRIKIQEQESTHIHVKKVLEKHVKQRAVMLKAEKLVKQTYQDCINQQLLQQQEKEMKDLKLKETLFLEDEERSKNLQDIINIKFELEKQFTELNSVLSNKQSITGFRDYFLQLQDDKTLMFEKVSQFEHLIEDTKEETQKIINQFDQIKTQRLEVNQSDSIEQLLEQQDILKRLNEELESEETQYKEYENELENMDILYSTLSKGIYCMIAQNQKCFKDTLPPNTTFLGSLQQVAENFLKIIDSLQLAGEDNIFGSRIQRT